MTPTAFEARRKEVRAQIDAQTSRSNWARTVAFAATWFVMAPCAAFLIAAAARLGWWLGGLPL
jgi:hypothetical protein